MNFEDLKAEGWELQSMNETNFARKYVTENDYVRLRQSPDCDTFQVSVFTHGRGATHGGQIKTLGAAKQLADIEFAKLRFKE